MLESVSDRTPRPHLVATATMWASAELTDSEKIVWYHTWLLDTTPIDGCYISAKSMGLRTGRSSKTVEDARASLCAMELLDSFPRPGANQRGWFAKMPPSLVPVARELQKATIEVSVPGGLREKLDERIRGYRAKVSRHRAEPQPDIGRKSVPRGDGGRFRKSPEGSSVSARSARVGEGVGGGAPTSASETIERSLPPAVTERQQQMGVGSHEPERQMGDARTRGQKITDEWLAVEKLKKGQSLTERERRDAADYAFRHATERPQQDTGT
jgi:hypothetical protein